MANINKLMNKSENKEQEIQAIKNCITLGDNTYKIKLLPWEDAMDLWEIIMKKVLPSVGAGLDYFQHDELDGSPSTFSTAFIHLAHNLDGETFKTFSYAILEGATVNGMPLVLKEQTSEFLKDWRKLFTFALKENFKGFFEEGWETGLSDLMTMVTPLMGQSDSQPE